jgi:hypothetical protein
VFPDFYIQLQSGASSKGKVKGEGSKNQPSQIYPGIGLKGLDLPVAGSPI